MYSSWKYLIILYIFATCKSDWIEITQTIETPSKPPGKVRHYNFPRNEYIYTTTSPTTSFERLDQTVFTSTAAATPTEQLTASPNEELIRNLTATTQPIFDNITPVTMEDRMDTLDTMVVETEQLVQTTENIRTVLEQKPNYWSTGKNGKATIVRVEDDEEIPKEKPKTEGFIPFLKRVQDELITKSHKNLRGKINMLKNLRDDMLLNIDERINHLWGRKSNEARDHKDEFDHDMHFPSNEGALMTIGFLTFAVFLIKLVLKLVQALKDKQNMLMVMPTMMTNTNAALIGRRKRDTTYAEQNEILQLIEEFSLT